MPTGSEVSRNKCKDCGSTTRKLRYIGARTTLCASCIFARRRKSKAVQQVQRDLRVYSLTPERAKEIMAKQGGLCGICGPYTKRRGVTRSLSRDHDHKCCDGATSCGVCVRGFLCGPCNKILGMIRDRPEIAFAMAEYLLNPPGRDFYLNGVELKL